MFCHVCALKMLFCFDMLLAKASLVCHVTSSLPGSLRFGQDGMASSSKESFRSRDPTSSFQLPVPNIATLCVVVYM